MINNNKSNIGSINKKVNYPRGKNTILYVKLVGTLLPPCLGSQKKNGETPFTKETKYNKIINLYNYIQIITIINNWILNITTLTYIKKVNEIVVQFRSYEVHILGLKKYLLFFLQ